MNMDNELIKARCENLTQRVNRSRESLKELLVGRTVKITGPYRDQPFGKSKPLQRGKLAIVHDVWINAHGDGVFMMIGDYRMSISIEDVEFV